MMRLFKGAAIVACAAMVVGAAPPPVLEPASPWAVDYAANSCRLVRIFGTGKWAGKLAFEQVSPHGVMSVLLVGNFTDTNENVLAFPPLPDVQIKSDRGFTTADGAQRVAFWRGGMGRGEWGLVSDAQLKALALAKRQTGTEASPSLENDLPPLDWKDRDWSVPSAAERAADDAGFNARAGKVTSLVLNPGTKNAVTLKTGPLDKPFKALAKCAHDSLKDWGIDPAVQDTVAFSAHPIVDPRRHFTANDYPRAALANAREDQVDVWLNIDAEGRITNCRSISAFDSPEINNAICDMVKRKERFAPARTREGRAVPDYFIQHFIFEMG